ncbi:hypothetical protein AN639_01665 [Candidatus Epulonipiscium fishelsonii]|uniref:Uncharacterized protein n=1 Tax=Candidatus Epulonipiscium fishelsonii TaxID=77094 RepID=A0ACC8XB86_9FIRM|nr:hypothetical protein AN639_01665 [Epulopiscium sp. SCG-B05WGA-EpuloA1]ONI39691.1 hypothetical protein AN396_07410 [Epulopiscium sp. SCG-B11WGA-EpuloA1]
MNKIETLKSLAKISFTSFILVIYFYIIYKQIIISDALFLSGVLYMCVALFSLVRYCGGFDISIYSFKKIFDREMDKMQALHEYTNQNPYNKSYKELLIISIIFIVVGHILSLK